MLEHACPFGVVHAVGATGGRNRSTEPTRRFARAVLSRLSSAAQVCPRRFRRSSAMTPRKTPGPGFGRRYRQWGDAIIDDAANSHLRQRTTAHPPHRRRRRGRPSASLSGMVSADAKLSNHGSRIARSLPGRAGNAGASARPIPGTTAADVAPHCGGGSWLLQIRQPRRVPSARKTREPACDGIRPAEI